MADASAIQKRPRGRPRKQQQVVAAAEAPIIDIVIDAALAKPNKPAPTKTKKLKDEKQIVSSAKPAPDKKTTKKSTASSGTNGSGTITKRKAATTKQTAADPPAAAAAASITPPSSAPQASSTSTRLQQRRKAAEPIPGPSIEPTGTIPSGTKPVEEAIATATSNHSKILSELAAQGSLPLQREEKDSGVEAARAEEGRQAQSAPVCDTPQQEEAQAQAAVGDELKRQEDLTRTASASAATQVTLPGRSTQTEDAAAAPAQLEPHSSPASAITPPPPPPVALTTTPTQTTPATMAGPQPPPPQPYRASPRQSRPSQPPAPAAPKPVEEQPWEPPQVRQWRQKQEQQRQSKWKPVEPLPLKYKPAARRVTLAMVAAPIAIVTSWALYDRLVLGKERKEMPRVAPSLANAVKDRDAEDKKM
ncbi:hypothetical protein DIS24_g4200 [Lasiodiplodia hormozganensis]|uniref:Uncharacterized protein n=1 Tax=Lasiodiplodia hormozganensis TaxID=869390 RepID=A0AA39YUW1_9PEZI|nr:hypothetical protein DIS24_g4200 [Lasiodiplodia hormozganensis]